MKLTAVVVLGGLCLATTANAAAPLEILTADITGPPGEPAWRRWEIGAQFAIPLPAADVATTEMGLKTGLTLTGMLNANVGVGLDVVYHDWPTSDEFKANYNAFLRHETSSAVSGTTTLRLSALQLAGHLKLSARSGGRMRPWLQVGAGAYFVDPNTSFGSGDLIYVVGHDATLPQSVGGACGTVGVDLERSGSMKFGLDASYDHVWTKNTLGSNFDAFTVGAHLLFGRW